jgi:hypothetical protein
MYVGIDNPISIAVENVSCKSLIIKASQGQITGSAGSYIYRGSKVGPVEIDVFTKSKGHLKKLGSQFFRLKLLWDPTFCFASRCENGEISKEQLKNQQFVRAELMNSDFQMIAGIKDFTVCIVRNNDIYRSIFNAGNQLNDSITASFQLAQLNDSVIFKNIHIDWFGYPRTLSPLRLVIVN